jgi:hypothetical protein
MSVTGAAANLLVAPNNLTASTVAFSTAGDKIGSEIEVVANIDATKWIILKKSSNAMTIS